MVKVKLGNWALLILSVVVIELFVSASCVFFAPPDYYLIACGSSKNVSFQGQTYVPDSGQSSFEFESEANSVVVVVGSPSDLLPSSSISYVDVDVEWANSMIC